MTGLAAVRRLLAIGTLPTAEPEIGRAWPVRLEPAALTPEWRAPWLVRLLTLVPFVVALGGYIAPRYFGGMGVAQPELFGLPLGAWVHLWSLTLAALGAAIVWRARSLPVAVAALLACTVPATIGLLLGPAIVLILQNLAP